MSSIGTKDRPDGAKRPSRRQIAAAATREEILLAARRLFGERGYARTSIAEIADTAGVSIPTIYASVGTKSQIVLALVGLVDFRVGAVEARARLEIETDPARLIALGVAVNRALLEQFGDVIEALRLAAAVEPEVAQAVENARQMHRAGATRLAQRLHNLSALRPGTSEEEAADVIGLLTDAEFCYSSLVHRYGWSFDRAETWINSTLQVVLLRRD